MRQYAHVRSPALSSPGRYENVKSESEEIALSAILPRRAPSGSERAQLLYVDVTRANYELRGKSGELYARELYDHPWSRLRPGRCNWEISRNASRNGPRNSFQGPAPHRSRWKHTLVHARTHTHTHACGRRIKLPAIRENCKSADFRAPATNVRVEWTLFNERQKGRQMLKVRNNCGRERELFRALCVF